MRKTMLFLCLLALLHGCACPISQEKDKAILAKVNNYEITKSEFEEEFLASAYGMNDTLQARKEFLTQLINRKLILQDACSKGMDKDKAFLKMIERFWEQSLLKIRLDKKTEEVTQYIVVSEEEVKDLYERLIKEGSTDKSYKDAQGQLKYQLLQDKQTRAMNEWLESLKNNSKIKINEGLLK